MLRPPIVDQIGFRQATKTSPMLIFNGFGTVIKNMFRLESYRYQSLIIQTSEHELFKDVLKALMYCLAWNQQLSIL